MTIRAARILVLAFALAILAAAPASAQCGLLGLFPCDTGEPPHTGPDPGGTESPQQPAPPPGKLFGFNTLLWGQDEGQWIVDFEVGRAHKVGANIQRTPVDWASLQPARTSPPLGEESSYPRGSVPQPSGLRQLDRLYDALSARDMRLLLIVNNAPKWASPQAHCVPLLGLYFGGCERVRDGKPLYPTEDELPAVTAFARALAERYPGIAIQTWNEPQYDGPDARLAGRMSCAIRAGARAASQPALVVSPSFAKFKTSGERAEDSTRRYLDAYYEAAAGCHDRFSMHAYTRANTHFGANSDLADLMRIFRDIRARHRDTTPIWVTEFGYTTTGQRFGEGMGYSFSQEQQAELTGRQYDRLVTMPDVEAAIVHTLRDQPVKKLNNPNDPEWGYGWLRTDGSPKPVYCAFAARAGGAC